MRSRVLQMSGRIGSTQTGRAILLMIFALLCFSLMDACVKAVSPQVGVLPALWARYAGQMLVVVILVAPRLSQVARTRRLGTQLLRSISLMCATAFFFSGLSFLPLAENATLMAINPVLVTLGAALFLGEALGPRRIAGIGVAGIGAVMVMRPGSELFSLAAILPLMAALCYSAYALLTRKVGRDEDVWTSLFYTGLVGTVLLSCVVPFAWVTPDAWGAMMMLGVALLGTLGQLALIRAFAQGEAAMLAPFAYAGLIFSALWGLVFFAEVPDIWTVLGGLVIAGAGIYVWQRETRQARRLPR